MGATRQAVPRRAPFTTSNETLHRGDMPKKAEEDASLHIHVTLPACAVALDFSPAAVHISLYCQLLMHFDI